MSDTTKVGKRGTVVIPSALRQRYGLDEGRLLVAEARDDGILLRPAVVLPVEFYDDQRKAEFLLSTAVDRDDYDRVAEDVRAMGIDPEAVPHVRPSRRARR